MAVNPILQQMQQNMHLNMTHFVGKGQSLLPYDDVTVVHAPIKDDTFNYVLSAKIDEKSVEQRVDDVLNFYLKQQLPFSWWVSELDTPPNLKEVLQSKGFKEKEDDIGMYLKLQDYQPSSAGSDLSFKRIDNKGGLEAFASIFASIGGYADSYDAFYSKVPLESLQGHYQMYLGYHDHEPIVTGILVVKESVGGVYFVMTKPSHRRRGHGSAMMHYLIQQAQNEKADLVTLQASSDGRGLYEKMGFKSLCRFVEYAYETKS